MSGFGTNPTTGSQSSLSANQFPLPSVAVPNTSNGDLTALEGGPASTDSNNNKTAPVSAYIKDGGDIAQGSTADSTWSGSGAATVISLLKKLAVELGATLGVSGVITANAGTNLNTSLLALESGGNLAASKADLDALVTALGTISDTAYSGSGNGSEIALLKKMVALLSAALSVTGTVTANAGTNTSTASLALESGGNLATLAGAITSSKAQTNIVQWNGSAPGVSNPVIDEDLIRAYIAAGQGFMASTGKQTSGGAIQTGFAIWNNTTVKNILVYSIKVGNAASGVHTLYLGAADPGLTGLTVTGYNAKAAGAAPSASIQAENAAITVGGTYNVVDTTYGLANQGSEMLLNGATILLPANALNGLLLSVTTSTNVWQVAIKWVEW